MSTNVLLLGRTGIVLDGVKENLDVKMLIFLPGSHLMMLKDFLRSKTLI